VEFTGSAVGVRVNRLCLAASDSSANTSLWSKLYFRRSQARARSEEWLIHAERGRTICSFVTRPGGRCHGHAQPKLPLLSCLPPSLLVPCCWLRTSALCSVVVVGAAVDRPQAHACRTSSFPWVSSLGNSISARRSSLKIMCSGCRRALQQASCKPRARGPLSRVDNGRAPRASDRPSLLHEPFVSILADKAGWLASQNTWHPDQRAPIRSRLTPVAIAFCRLRLFGSKDN
jgi:hypothetical protein